MIKITKLTLFSILTWSMASCANYNEIVPDWAKIGERAEAQVEESDKKISNDDVDWWNPLTWF